MPLLKSYLRILLIVEIIVFSTRPAVGTGRAETRTGSAVIEVFFCLVRYISAAVTIVIGGIERRSITAAAIIRWYVITFPIQGIATC
jgi:hypothetical protein